MSKITAKIAGIVTTVKNGSITENKLDSTLLAHIKKDYMTPQMFGAAGDGKTDDTRAFVNMLASNATSFFIPPGKYKANFTISKNNISIVGAGRMSQIVSDADITVNLQASNVILDGLYIESTTGTALKGYDVSSILTNCTINNCRFVGASFGAYFNTVNGFLINNCRFAGTDNTALRLINTVDSFVINNIFASSGTGLDVGSGSVGNTINGVVSHDNKTYGVDVKNGGNKISNVRIYCCGSESTYGMRINSKAIVCNNIEIQQCYNGGLLIGAEAHNCIINALSLIGNSYSGTPSTECQVEGDYNQVAGSICMSHTWAGVSEKGLYAKGTTANSFNFAFIYNLTNTDTVLPEVTAPCRCSDNFCIWNGVNVTGTAPYNSN